MNRTSVGCLVSVLAGAVWASEPPDLSRLPSAATGKIEFQRDVQPILAAKCVSCHGPAKQRGGLRLDRAADSFKGGDSGSVVTPGDAAGSRLLLLVAGLDPDVKQMPPAPQQPLKPAEIGNLR